MAEPDSALRGGFRIELADGSRAEDRADLARMRAHWATGVTSAATDEFTAELSRWLDREGADRGLSFAWLPRRR